MTTPLQKAALAVIDKWAHSHPLKECAVLELRKALEAEIAQTVEPVAVFNGLVDSGEHGAFNLDMLKMIPRGAPLYLHPPQQATTPVPDLLKEFKNVMSWIDIWSPEFSYDPNWPDDRDKARSAIAAAQGEKP